MREFEFSVNPEGIKRTLEHTFSSQQTFLKELVQNAERAGSSRVEVDIDLDRRIVIVSDLGCGFDEDRIEAFFTAGCDSLWDEKVIAEQLPFGIGAAACLYASDELSIVSNNLEVTIDNDSFLKNESKAVVETMSEKIVGTMIGLRIKESIDLKRIKREAETWLFEGFAIAVFINGKEVKRSESPTFKGRYEWIDADFGKVGFVDDAAFLHGGHTRGICLYLQGYEVNREGNSNGVVVHLDSKIHCARVPDRDRLIGNTVNDAVGQKVTNLIKHEMLKRINKERKTLDIRDFSARYYEILSELDSESAADLPVPARYFKTMGRMPFVLMENEEFDDELFFNENSKDHRKAVYASELPEIVFGRVDNLEYKEYSSEDEEKCLDISSFCYLAQLPILDDRSRNSDINKKVLDIELDAERLNLKVEATNPRVVNKIALERIGVVDLVFCDSYKAMCYLDSNEQPIAEVSVAAEMWLFKGALYIPLNVMSVDDTVRQVVNCETGNEWISELNEDYFSDVVSKVESLIAVYRNNDDCQLIKDIMRRAWDEIARVKDRVEGKEFSIKFVFGERDWNTEVVVSEI